ncbi:GNAT family N-acetyltransferase [Hydrogenophaga sp. 5NK40-0174]|uniref:GNAT family N-acetyltransferase n=1 Tax=Hydrogenophaga sp. 5NK40-0174 TaxID=3127649 RepID=UPI0031070D50
MNIHLGYRPGCIGRVTELHASFYSRTVGFGAPFEAKVAAELAQFCLDYTPGRDGLWLAEQEDGQLHGSIAIDGSHYQASGAHLRWFITSDHSRGNGLGSSLLNAAMDFCKASGYERIYLWTFDELHAARHLYEKHGFRLSRSQRGAQWGKEVNEQMFTLGMR